MKNFFKENWFKVGLLLLALILIFFFLIFPRYVGVQCQKIASDEADGVGVPTKSFVPLYPPPHDAEWIAKYNISYKLCMDKWGY